jgi:hypothetical protein
MLPHQPENTKAAHTQVLLERATWLGIGVIAYGRGFVYSRVSCGP